MRRTSQKSKHNKAPGSVNLEFQRATQLQTAGDFAAAEKVLLELLRRHPKETALLNRLGRVAFSLGKVEAAAQYFTDSLAFKPGQVDILANLGVACRRLKRFEQALACQRKAIELNPNHAHAHNNLGILLGEWLNQPDDAIKAFEQAIALDSTMADAYYNKANLLKDRGDYSEAILIYGQAIALNPGHGDAFLNMAIAYSASKNYSAALSHYKTALDLNVSSNFVAGHYLYTCLQVCDWTDFYVRQAALARDIIAGQPVCAPFQTHTLFDDPVIQQKAVETFAAIEYPVSNATNPVQTHAGHRRIKIGYFSSDYWNHPVTHLMLGLFAAHDRDRFEVIAFSFGKPPKDIWHERAKNACDQFIEVSHLSDKEIVELAQNMEIDIAVDLNGFTEHRRTGIFALRAAPVQVSYIGFLGTMGTPCIDYLIADEIIVPPENRQFFNEKIIYLPSYQINDPEQAANDRPLLRAEFGLADDQFVYCCFNNNYKITPAIFDSWMRILQRVSNSVLWLYVNNEMAIDNLQREAGLRGIDPERIIFAKRVPLSDHLARLRLADLFLDTLPYNAGATASNALRVGLPVLTQTGRSFAGRMGTSLLNSIGMNALVTDSEAEYEALAVELALDRPMLTALRNQLAENLKTHALFDNYAFARNVETAFRVIHERACNGLKPMHVLVK